VRQDEAGKAKRLKIAAAREKPSRKKRKDSEERGRGLGGPKRL